MMTPEEAVDHAVANARLAGVNLGSAWTAQLFRLATGEVEISDLVDLRQEQPEVEPRPCWTCTTPTTKVALSFEAPMCSAPCLVVKYAELDVDEASHPEPESWDLEP